MNPGDRPTDPQELEGVDPMGRGRQKAKQMKVARRLKYFTPETDLEALQRELSGVPGSDDFTFSDDSDQSDEEETEDDDYWD